MGGDGLRKLRQIEQEQTEEISPLRSLEWHEFKRT